MSKYKSAALMLLAFILINAQNLFSQTITPSSNASYVGMEKNLLFRANSRYQVTQTGTRSFGLADLFDGSFMPQYITGFDGTEANKIVIEISGLPNFHTQVGAYVGFTTRYLPPKAFKIEGYDVWNGYNAWRTIADVTNNPEGMSTFMTPVIPSEYTKLRFTFKTSQRDNGDTQGWIGISELFFLHAEASKAYDGLMVQYEANGNVGIGNPSPAAKLDIVQNSGTLIKATGVNGFLIVDNAQSGANYYGANDSHHFQINGQDKLLVNSAGNVAIGPVPPTEKLTVDGKVKAREIKVQPTGWPDYVFEPHYLNPSLADIEAYVKMHKRLPEIPSAKQVDQEGVALGEMNKLLLKKIEELTLHLIQLNKRIEQLEAKK